MLSNVCACHLVLEGRPRTFKASNRLQSEGCAVLFFIYRGSNSFFLHQGWGLLVQSACSFVHPSHSMCAPGGPSL